MGAPNGLRRKSALGTGKSSFSGHSDPPRGAGSSILHLSRLFAVHRQVYWVDTDQGTWKATRQFTWSRGSKEHFEVRPRLLRRALFVVGLGTDVKPIESPNLGIPDTSARLPHEAFTHPPLYPQGRPRSVTPVFTCSYHSDHPGRCLHADGARPDQRRGGCDFGTCGTRLTVTGLRSGARCGGFHRGTIRRIGETGSMRIGIGSLTPRFYRARSGTSAATSPATTTAPPPPSEDDEEDESEPLESDVELVLPAPALSQERPASPLS